MNSGVAAPVAFRSRPDELLWSLSAHCARGLVDWSASSQSGVIGYVESVDGTLTERRDKSSVTEMEGTQETTDELRPSRCRAVTIALGRGRPRLMPKGSEVQIL